MRPARIHCMTSRTFARRAKCAALLWLITPAFPVLISRGIGMSILPVRFGVPPEIGEITLTRA